MPDQRNGHQMQHGSILRPVRSTVHLPDSYSANFIGTPHGALAVPSHFNITGTPLARHDLPTRDLERHIFSREIDGIREPVDFDEALKETGFGRFHCWLTLVCGLIYFTSSASTTLLSLLLPASACQLHISSTDRGLINASPLAGMFLGTFVWGAMSDTLGRKYVMIVCLLLDFLASLATSFSFHKWFLLACRTVNGFGVVGTTSLVFAYMGEFLYPEQRDTLLLSLELFWSLGLTYIPALGLLILRMDFSTDIGFTTYNPWNLFVFVSGLTSLLALLALVSLPESPKFLMTDGQLEKTRNILVRMFTVNTRRPESEYPVHLVIDPVTIRRYMRLEGRHVSMRQESTVYIKGLGAAHMNLFRTLPVRIAKTCLIDFAVSFSYWSLVLWIPELLYRHQMYTKGGEGVSLCEAATGVPGGGQDSECHSRIDNDVFYHSLIICASCIPTTLVVYLMIMYIDKRIVLGHTITKGRQILRSDFRRLLQLLELYCDYPQSLKLRMASKRRNVFYQNKKQETTEIGFLLAVAGGATFALNLLTTDAGRLVAFCALEAFGALVETVLFVCVVELFPVAVRGTALSITVTSGRVGAVLGNILMGTLIDTYCTIPVYMFATSFIVGAVVAATLPDMRRGHG